MSDFGLPVYDDSEDNAPNQRDSARAFGELLGLHVEPEMGLGAMSISKSVSSGSLYLHKHLSINNLSSRERREFIDALPTLAELDIVTLKLQGIIFYSIRHHRRSDSGPAFRAFIDESCPICYNTFMSSIAEEEMAVAMDSPAVASQHLGVTRLSGTCGHAFCRKECVSFQS